MNHVLGCSGAFEDPNPVQYNPKSWSNFESGVIVSLIPWPFASSLTVFHSPFIPWCLRFSLHTSTPPPSFLLAASWGHPFLDIHSLCLVKEPCLLWVTVHWSFCPIFGWRLDRAGRLGHFWTVFPRTALHFSTSTCRMLSRGLLEQRHEAEAKRL